MAKDVQHILASRPGLKLCTVADSESDNWEFLKTLGEGRTILDFFHATEKVREAVAETYGDGTRETRHAFERLRDRLLLEDGGATAVINAIAYLHKKYPRREKM